MADFVTKPMIREPAITNVDLIEKATAIVNARLSNVSEAKFREAEPDEITGVVKLQRMGVDTNGKPRYMIYLSGAVRKAGWSKADLVEFHIKRIRRAPLEVKDEI